MKPVPSRRATPHSSRASDAVVTLPGSNLVFRSAGYLKALARVTRFAQSNTAPVLIEGESGTGKTRLARVLHAKSRRANGPFETAVLSAMDDELAGTHLFGHIAGAYTDAKQSRLGHFVAANGGTLFLDEIGKASLAVQQKLLNAIEYGEIRPLGSDRDLHVDVRVVTATNVSLDRLVDGGRFLADLDARISAFRVWLPPLRERRPDIPILAEHYVDAFAADCGYDVAPRIDDDLMAALKAAEWPNNMRELAATIHRILLDADGAPVLTPDHCLDDLMYLRATPDAPQESVTIAAIEAAVARTGSTAAAARLLGVDRTTIYRIRRRHGAAEGPKDN